MSKKQNTVKERDKGANAIHEQPEHEQADSVPVEVGGRKGPEPTRYGDWEKNGRCIDF